MPERTYLVRVDEDDAQQLAALVEGGTLYGGVTVEQLLESVARTIADGVRRPGSWERGLVLQLTGSLM